MKAVSFQSLVAVLLFAMHMEGVEAQVKTAEPVDALDLTAESPPETPAKHSGDTKEGSLFVEATTGGASRRYGFNSRALSRVSLDARGSSKLGDGFRGALSARLDSIDPADPALGHVVLSLREGFIGWQDADKGQLVEVGRINLREGPGYGYNPSDFFRAQTLRTQTTQNPFALRENRLGTTMLRWQQQWEGAAVGVALAPKVQDGRSRAGWSADLGATNSSDRGLLSLGLKLSERADFKLEAFKDRGGPLRWGANASALVSDAVVVHGELATSHEPSLLERALGVESKAERRQRSLAGFTFTSASKLSLTVEYLYNGFALDRAGWQTLAATEPAALASYGMKAQEQQDSASRTAWFFYLVQKDILVRNLELTALARINRSDDSQLLWLDLRYRMSAADIALQIQHTNGPTGSEFGLPPVRNSVQLAGTWYF